MMLPIARRNVTRAAAVALLLLVAGLACRAAETPADPTDDGWTEVADGGTVVAFRDDDARAGRLMLEIATSRAPGIAAGMSLATLEPVRIIVASSHEEFEAHTTGGASDWWVGCAFPERGLVIMKSPRIVDYPLQMEDVLVHELAHVAAGRVLEDVWVPRWFHEGVAMAVAGEWRLSESPSLAAAAARGTLYTLSSLERAFPGDANGAALAYAESFHAVQFLMAETGIPRPGELVRAVREAGGFDAALETLYGGDRSGFEAAALGHFDQSFSWALILTRWNLIFAFATVLFLVAVVVRVRRARRQMREWATEEAGYRPGGKRTRPSSWE